ncbi:MAG: VCBS repeat-containing protein [Planctomycetes bacterium]|nr:VCBS repeat-containing protein [Planctomycetota bacterium]
MMLNNTLEVTTRTKFALFSVLTIGLVASSSAMGGSPDTCQLPMFENPEYCLITRPFSVATGDLDGDGNLDLVAGRHKGQPLPNSIVVRFGRGDNTFGDQATYDGGVELYAVAIGDLDADGDLDLVALDAGGFDFGGPLPGKFTVFLNAGDGTFSVHMTHGLGLGPQSMALGDLDGDGDLDMAVAVTRSDAVTTFRNNGDGTFVFIESYPTSEPQAIAIGDLDGDGALDFVTANWFQHAVSVRLNNGDATFGSALLYDSGTRPISVAIGDLDGDGDADLVVSNHRTARDFSATTVSVLQNNGDGTFSAPVPFDVGERPTCVRLADLDGDGDLDLAVSNLFSDDVSVLMNNGDATFAAQITSSVGSGPYAVTIGDFNGDGNPDLAVANMFGNTLSVLPNLGDGVIMDVVQYDVGALPVAVAIGDLDGDGDLDLAVTNRLGPFVDGTVSLLFNLGDGSFKKQVVLDTGDGPESVVIGDLNGDGDADLAVANTESHNLSFYLNNGDGTFADAVIYETGSSSSPVDLAIGDLDGDGDLDLAVVNAESANVAILLNTGNGSFADQVTYPVGGGGFSEPFSIVLGDVDGDGDLDFATANLDPSNVSVFRNNGDGTFGDEVTYPLVLPESVAFGDLDGDGDLDLIIANQFVNISLNDGDGNFGPPTTYQSCRGAFHVTTGDLDGDGDLDIVLTDISNTVGFLANNGDATFAEVELFRVGGSAFGVAVGDLNGDGALDLAAPNFQGDSVSVLLNSSTNSSGDLDDDCDVDLLDFAGFADCMSGPGGGVSVGCEPLDFESDGDVDMDDFHVFQRAFSGG